MSDISWVDLFLRHIPESFIIILAGYAVSRKAISIKPYLASGFFLGIISFLIKFLPISQIMHMALSVAAAILFLILLCKIKALHAIISSLTCFVLTIATEAVNMIILTRVFSLDMNLVFQVASPLKKNLYGLPSLTMFAIIVIIYYIIYRKKENDAAIKKNN